MSSYNHQKIEKKWREKWQKDKIYEPDLKKAKNPFYNLMMFPYPSAEGMHVGNIFAFVGSDIYGRYQRMKGYDVFEPIGLDGFGIHSENYALSINEHPMRLAKKTEKNFYHQLEIIGNSLSWQNKLETYDPEYYRWTQWIFIQLFKNGLAYRKKAEVNWCPSCKTVLADEQVISGECERCEHEVVKKELEQWFFKTTKYAQELLEDLEKIDWSERVKTAQRNWIGKSEGTEIDFKIQDTRYKIQVFTTRPDTVFGATYMVLSPEHELIEKLDIDEEVKEYVETAKKKTREERRGGKTGIEIKGVKAVNPATNEEIPIWVSDYVLAEYGTGAIMAVPAHDQRDFEFAKKFNLAIKMVVCPNYPEPTCPILDKAYESEGYLVASGEFDGIESKKAISEITKWLEKKNLAKKKTTYRLRDWLISRQRYWGPPIPMILCQKCNWQPVPEKDLPIVLPDIENFRPTGTEKSPLATVGSFYKTQCPKCGGEARRETDVSDVFLDSAFYYFRYIDVNNEKEIFNKKTMEKWLPVDMYIGGAEHAVLHLLYSRFLTKVFADIGLISFREPYKKFRAHGLIIKDGAKMSKSKGNIVVPDDYIKKFGADAVRMYLMFLGPFEQGGDFRDEGISGITRFLNRVYNLKFEIRNSPPKADPPRAEKLDKLLHQSIKKITEDIENLRFNTAISQLMILLNGLERNKELGIRNYEVFLKLLAPFAPYLTEELWGGKKSIHLSDWPKYDSQKIKEESFELVVQINGKVRDKIEAPIAIKEQEAKELALGLERIKKYTKGKTIRKVIFVPGRLINIVL